MYVFVSKVLLCVLDVQNAQSVHVPMDRQTPLTNLIGRQIRRHSDRQEEK